MKITKILFFLIIVPKGIIAECTSHIDCSKMGICNVEAKKCTCVEGYTEETCSKGENFCGGQCAEYTYTTMWPDNSTAEEKKDQLCINTIPNFVCNCHIPLQNTCAFGERPIYSAPILYFNRIMIYGVDASAMVTVLYLGKIWFKIEAYCKNFHWGLMESRDLKKESSLSSIAGALHIDWSKINRSVTKGYMIKKTLRMYDIGEDRMHFKLTAFNGEVFFQRNMNFYIVNFTCAPTFEKNQFKYHQHDYTVYYPCATCIELMLLKPCGYNDYFKHYWTWMTYGGERAIKNFTEKGTRLIIPSYFFKDKNSKDDLFMVRYGLREYYNLTEPFHGVYIYIKIYHEPPQAIIRGNSYPKVNAQKSIVLDGGYSSEFGIKNYSYLSYHWTCSSTDLTNAFCNGTQSKKGRTLSIEPNTLSTGYKYNFMLNVSTWTSRETRTFTQVLDLVTYDVLNIHIDCLRNCKNDMYNNQETIHFLAKCIHCESSGLKYEWKAGDQIAGFKKRLLLESSHVAKYSKNNKLRIELKISSGGKFGSTYYDLKSAGDKLFDCKVSPTSGKELETPITINCDQTYSYYYYTNNNELIYHIIFGRYELNPMVLHNTPNLLINGYAKSLSKFTKNVNMGLVAQPIIRNADELMKFIHKKMNYSRLISFGKSTDVLNLLFFAAKQLKHITNKIDNKNITIMLLDILDKTNRTCAVEQHQAFTMSAEIFINSMETDMPFVQRISKYIYTIVLELLMGNINGHELCRTFFFDFEIFNRNVYNIFHKMIKYFKPHSVDFRNTNRATTDLPSYQEYQNYGIIGNYLLAELRDYLDLTRQFKSIMHNLAATASVIRYAGEPTIIYDFTHTMVRIDFLDIYNLQYLTMTIKDIIVIYSVILQKQCFKLLKTNEITLQTIVTDRNIHRWLPQDGRLFSKILYVTLVNAKNKTTRLQINDDIKTLDIEADIRIKFPTKNLDVATNPHTKIVVGKVYSKGDMPVYKIQMPKNCLILIWIGKHEKDLLILHRVGKRPTHNAFVNSNYTHLPVGSEQEVKLINYHKHITNGYLSILPAKSMESNFTIIVKVYSCEVYFYYDTKWSSERCTMQHHNITPEYIPCHCYHLTAFALAMHVPRIVLEKDRKFLNELPVNKVFALFLAILALLFTILFIIAYCLERRSNQVIVIPSLCKQGDYKYYVTFFTGLQNNAGTTANITISLYGSEGHDTFILPRSIFHKSFTSGSVTTVLLVTKYLGQILRIGASIDNFGHSPSWYLHMVRIKDYEKKHEYVFFVSQWLSLIYNNKTECLVKLTSERALKRKTLLCKEYAKTIFADSEFHFLLLGRPGRLNQSRKTMILFTTIMVTILVIILFFEKTTLNNYEDEDANFRREMLPAKYIKFSALAALVSLVVSNLLLILFSETGDVKYKLVHTRIIEV